jgi:hypothetical protein
VHVARYTQDYKHFDAKGVEIIDEPDSDGGFMVQSDPSQDEWLPPPYTDFPPKRLQEELKHRTGRGARPGTDKKELIGRLTVLDRQRAARV